MTAARAYWTRDSQGLYDRALAAGYTVGQAGQIGGEQGRFAYFDTEHDQGTVIEISDIGGPKGDAERRAMVARQAAESVTLRKISEGIAHLAGSTDDAASASLRVKLTTGGGTSKQARWGGSGVRSGAHP